MNIGKLRRFLEENSDLDDRIPVVVPGQDHNFNPVYFSRSDIVWNRDARRFFEYHGDNHLADGEVRITAVVIE